VSAQPEPEYKQPVTYDETNQQVNLATSQQSPLETNSLVNKYTDEQVPKARITVYVPDELANQLEEARLQVKRLTGRKGYAVSRSALAEAAITMLIDDFEANREYSYLAEWVNLTQ
jgi:hypothetical protein